MVQKKKSKKIILHSDKSPKEASNLFNSIMKASVSGNPKPKKKVEKKK